MESQWRVVIYCGSRPGVWIAQCLERDIAAQGQSLPGAMDAFEDAVRAVALRAHDKNEPLYRDIGPAPERFKIMYDTAQPLEGVRHIVIRLPDHEEETPAKFAVAA